MARSRHLPLQFLNYRFQFGTVNAQHRGSINALLSLCVSAEEFGRGPMASGIGEAGGISDGEAVLCDELMRISLRAS